MSFKAVGKKADKRFLKLTKNMLSKKRGGRVRNASVITGTTSTFKHYKHTVAFKLTISTPIGEACQNVAETLSKSMKYPLHTV